MSNKLLKMADNLADFMWRHNYIEDPAQQLIGYMGYELQHFHDHSPPLKHWYEETRCEDGYLSQISEKVEKMFKEVPPFTDVMGPLYMAIRSRSKGSALGQFFTPQSVCDMMAMMTIDPDLVKQDKMVKIQEPCSGSGAMLMAAAKIAYEQGGSEALSKIEIHANDLDPMCTGMTTLQFMYNWIENKMPLGRLVTYNGNALGDLNELEVWFNVSNPASKYASMEKETNDHQHQVNDKPEMNTNLAAVANNTQSLQLDFGF